LPGITMAGKTGTAQVVRVTEEDSEQRDEKEVPYKFRDHAWFVGYAPAEAPQLVVVALVEHGGHGASAAAPLVGEMMEEFFKEKLTSTVAQKSD
ncbi:MAG: penicillin-binding transpeptidase domain-containing protein, partial [Syntrophobacteria bacterium]